MEHGERGYFPGPEELSDEDFVKAYPTSGFGWSTGTEADDKIWERHARLENEHPELYIKWHPAKMSSSESGRRPNDDEQLPKDIMPDEPTRNLEGQVVDPSTNEPVRRGSPEWQELAERNMLPLDQEGQRR